MIPCVGMTTAPRVAPTVSQSIKSVNEAGWSNVWLFAEPNTLLKNVPVGTMITRNKQQQYAVRNFHCMVRTLVEAYPDVDYYLLLQDDIQVAKNARQYLEQSFKHLKTERKVVHLYTPSTAQKDNFVGWHNCHNQPQQRYGALAYAVPSPIARQLRNEPFKGKKAGIDSRLGLWCSRHNIQQIQHSPSLVRHTGHYGAINSKMWITPPRQCKSFCEDASELMK